MKRLEARWLVLLLLPPLCAGGASVCANCHPVQAKFQPGTSMAHALETVPNCTILRDNPLLTFREGKYSYRIERQGERSIYSVTDGQNTISVPIAWALGLGSAGQTYVLEINGELYESRVSYFSEVKGLDLTMGAQGHAPGTLLEAAGRFISRAERFRCFGCHSTDAFQQKQLTLDKLIPGVQCERCHGPSEEHLAKLTPMKKLGSLSTEDVSNFCGQCHRTWEEIAAGGTHGIVNVRFQPYRLTMSKCYDTEDKRISCLACHDPHREVDRRDVDYDAKCQACHSKGAHPAAKICRVSTSNCVSCHMPKLELPGAHYRFTDHRIRIVRAGEKYAD